MIKETLLLNLPPFALLAGMWIVATLEQRQRAGVRPPVKDKLLRPPGHTLAKRVEELQETAFSRFMFALVTAVLVGSLVSWRGNKDLASQFTAAFLASLMVAAFVAALRPRKELRNCALGLRGEQMMAEELDKLTREGYWIFHDFPGGPDWNIDHVAVGPAGVFAIETKTRRKQEAAAGTVDNQVVFDGEKLLFGTGVERGAIPQAERQAKALSKFLETAVGEKVWVTPVIAIPGWWVVLKAKCPFPILSGRQTTAFIREEKPKLSDKLVRQVVHQLDQKCRDVEF